MSVPQSQRVTVELLGKEHEFACPEGQEDALIAAASNLNNLVERMKQRSSVRNEQNALLMAALNLSHELLESQADLTEHEQSHQRLIDKLHKQLTTP
ncbi:cell division protein ZapA [Pseudoalteromonas mariniglutinosa]|uniref:cell division protein ZapA n=1 Tax=Pseudoalteromonas mariniglutinosa TaxID=206042 RepID=UPI00384A8AC8